MHGPEYRGVDRVVRKRSVEARLEDGVSDWHVPVADAQNELAIEVDDQELPVAGGVCRNGEDDRPCRERR